MIRRKFMPARLLQPGMKVDQSVIDRMGRTLIARNSTLDEYIISSMLNLGIMSIYIQDGEYDPADDEKKITPAAKKILSACMPMTRQRSHCLPVYGNALLRVFNIFITTRNPKLLQRQPQALLTT